MVGLTSRVFLILQLMERVRRSPVEVGSLCHCLQGVVDPRWCRISSINGIVDTMGWFELLLNFD